MSDGARVLTTAEVESWQVALGRRWGARIGPRGHEVVIDGDRILATTRALEKIEEGLKLWHELPPDERAMVAIENAGKMWRGAVAERDSAIARAENAERERDEARGEARAHRAALDDATASCHGLGCGRCEDCVSMQRERAEKAERELADISRQTVDGSVVAKMSRKSLERFAVRLHQERNTAEAERDAARATISVLVTALEGLFVEYDHLRNAGSKHALTYWVDRLPDHACAECVPGGPIVEPGFRCREHAARAALAKSKGTANGSR